MAAEIYLNIYDISCLNSFLNCFGIGAYHTGVQIDNTEYMFGADDEYETGVCTCNPKWTAYPFRESIYMGKCTMDQAEIAEVISDLMIDYIGTSYDIFKRNCNHFANELCVKLLNKTIPQSIFNLPNCLNCIRCIVTKKFLKGGFDKIHSIHKDSLFLGKKRIISHHNSNTIATQNSNTSKTKYADKPQDNDSIEMNLLDNKDMIKQ